ncbi:hypothetical protein [Sphingomonas sp. GM_Shp_2]|uniref:hypothetical protein n=1 Tax=Sphingomonas sp. GM_Shp_2 TaxID=2937380 RepID=UPI00226A2DA5|nr:hypothetical protein [Sphingomonas sp. GM_Shp_2]
MRISRYLDAKAFLDEAKALKMVRHHITDAILERLERQRSLVPRLRLHYPEPIERRWWADDHETYDVGGEREPDGQRWDDACALEKARHGQRGRWGFDPTVSKHPLDDPEERFRQFIEKPADVPFVPWTDYRVSVNAEGAAPLYTSNTVVTYYSSWQLLQYAEVVNMGVTSFMNLLGTSGWPSAEDIAAAPQSISILPVHAMRGFAEHEAALDAMVWFAEEERKGYEFATRADHHRRLISETERAEIMRIRCWAAEQATSRFGVDAEALLAANRFLFEQWAEWERDGRPLIAGAYKTIAAHGVRLACLTAGVSVAQYKDIVGQVGGYLKPILDVIWPSWVVEQREDVRRVLVSYRRADAMLQADFDAGLIDRFLDFVEANDLHGFYWRFESFNRHSFKGNDQSLEGLKGDVQGMALIVEHIASALGGKSQQLNAKFKELWAGHGTVLKLLKDNAVMKVGNGKGIDLAWFEARNALGGAEQIAADLAITYAIRGGAHRVIEETDPLKLERMMLILLRAAVRTFAAVAPLPPAPAAPATGNPKPAGTAA